MKNSALAFLLSLVLVFNSHAFVKEFPPLLRNFTDKDYNARFQNWDITQDSNGVMYFANNGGLLCFDGYSWNLSPLPNGTILRSIYFDDDRIYNGTYKSFGYFQKNDRGEFDYHPLFFPNDFNDNERIDGNEEIWKILKWNNLILFQSFDNIYSYDPSTGKVDLISHRIKEEEQGETNQILNPLFIYTDGNSLFAQRSNGGFYKYENSVWIPYWTIEQLGSPIMGFISPSENPETNGSVVDGTLLLTRNSGLFKVKDNQPYKFKTEIDAIIEDAQINRVCTYHDGSIFIGTIGKGLLHIDSEGKLIEQFDTSNGLNNNTILGIMEDMEGNLWVALDDGIALIYSGLPIKILSNTSRYKNTDIGMVYGIGSYDNRISLASNQGLYYIDTDGNLTFEEELKGQNWFVSSFDNQTIIGGNDETLLLNKDRSSLKYPFSGTAIKMGRIHNKETLILANYHDLHVFFKSDDGNWFYNDVIRTLGDPIRQVEIDNDGTIWCGHLANGLIKLKLDPSLTTIVDRTDFPSLINKDTSESLFLFKLAGTIYFTNGHGIYKWNDDIQDFEKAESLGILNKIPFIKTVTTVDDDSFWVACANAYHFIKKETNGNYRIDYSVPLDIFRRINNGENSFVFCKDRKAYLSLNGGFAEVEMEKIPSNTVNFPLMINKVGAFNETGQFVLYPISNNPDPSFDYDNLYIELSHPNYSGTPLSYRFELRSGSQVLDTICNLPQMRYPNLSWGNNYLHCEVLDINGNVVREIDYNFHVKRPWGLNWWAIALYVLIVIALTWLVSGILERRRRKKKQHEYEEAKAIQDARIKEQELMIARQQRQLLESELSEKSKELASMALGAYARQQAIDNMKQSLADLKRKGKFSEGAEKVLDDISKSSGDNRVFWDTFEKNFDLIHEHFFRNLRQAYPSLTSSDLKFCALLRMNMTTKEISRFTNLSVRGVETARYRLRKKFALLPDASLVQFLIDFNM